MDDPGAGARDRGHEALPHTADVGLRAWAPGLEALFEEAASALIELTVAPDSIARGPGRPGAPTARPVELAADDLVALAFAWLNELIGLADAEQSVVEATCVSSVRSATSPTGSPGPQPPGPQPPGWQPRGWQLSATVRLVSRDAVRVLHDVKSATYHGLSVERRGLGWTLSAYLDV